MESVFLAGFAVLSVAVVANLALTLVLARRISRSSAPMGPPNIEVGLEKGAPAPDFRAETDGGETVTLASYAARKVSFIFMSSVCPPCTAKLPALHALEAKARQAGVELVLVLGNLDQAACAAFVQQHQITLPVLIAQFGKNPFMDDYKALGMPSHCTLNQHSRVEASGLLGPDWEQQLTGAWAAMQHPAQQLQLSAAG